MIRITLTDPERTAVQALRRDRDAAPARAGPRGNGPALRDRSDSPRDSRPSRVLRRHRAHGAQAVHPNRSHQLTPPAPRAAERSRSCRAGPDGHNRRLDEARTWTAKQLAHALQEEGIRLSTRQTRKYLKRLGANWRRTTRSLTHKQHPAQVEQAKRKLAHLEKRGPRATSNSLTSTSVALAPASR